MKQLQKYYAENPMSLAIDDIGPYYDASEADAAFAEMRREYSDAFEKFTAESHAAIAKIEREHAEEIERLKAGQRQIEMIGDWNDAHFKAIEKQAERYEKLRKLNPQQFLELWKTNLMGPRFDDLVDQLPASGESQK